MAGAGRAAALAEGLASVRHQGKGELTMGIIDIIALVAERAPKVIGAGRSVADLRQSAGGIIADVALRLKALVDAQLAALDRNGEETRAGQESLIATRSVFTPWSAMQ
jgi:hypothetical protein